MSNINKAAVLNPFTDITANILDFVPRATTSEFGIVAIGSGINVDHLGRIYLDTQEYSDRLATIEAQAASTLATQKSEVAAAIAQVNLAQSQTITALTLEVNNLKTNLTDSITATQTDLINRADQLAQNVTDITDQLALDKAAFTQEIQDALVYLEQAESVASALRTPRKINGVNFDGTADITVKNIWEFIPSGANLNDYTTAGTYYVDQDSVAATIANSPLPHSFSLRVDMTAGVIQELTTYAGGGSRRFIRGFYNVWSQWEEVVKGNKRLRTDNAQTGIVAPNTAAGIYIRDDGNPFLWQGTAPTAPRWDVAHGGTGGTSAAE